MFLLEFPNCHFMVNPNTSNRHRVIVPNGYKLIDLPALNELMIAIKNLDDRSIKNTNTNLWLSNKSFHLEDHGLFEGKISIGGLEVSIDNNLYIPSFTLLSNNNGFSSIFYRLVARPSETELHSIFYKEV